MNLARPILYSFFVAALISMVINFFFFKQPFSLEMAHSLFFFTSLAILSGILYRLKTEPKTFIGIAMYITIGRFLLASIAFYIYINTFTFHENSLIAHFMTNYFVFTIFEILFLLKIVATKPTSK